MPLFQLTCTPIPGKRPPISNTPARVETKELQLAAMKKGPRASGVNTAPSESDEVSQTNGDMNDRVMAITRPSFACATAVSEASFSTIQPPWTLSADNSMQLA